MASIIADLSDDIKKMKSLKEEIQQVKKELGSINIKVELDIKRDMEARLKALTGQYDALVQKVAQAEAKIAESTTRINKSAETVIKAQEQITKSASGQADSSVQGASGGNSAATNAQTASVQAQAKAYDELANEINKILGTREQNIRKLVEEQNAIQKNNDLIKQAKKDYTNNNGVISEKGLKLLEVYNNNLLRHKAALSEIQQVLGNEEKLYSAAEGSMKRLSQELGRMRIAYRAMTDEQKISPFGQELLASIEQADAKIKQLDASIGNHQRNVGNYASGWNGLSMSIQQIGRELPSLAVGWSTFFLAISNNLPILTDEIKRAKDEYNALKAAGQQATPVWKQVVSSLLSWQTALTVGITLLTMYGSEIIDWVSGLFKAQKQLDLGKESVKAFNDAMLKGGKSAQQEVTTLNLLYNATQNVSKGMNERLAAVEKLQQQYPSYFANFSKEDILAGKAADSYVRLAQSITASAKAQAARNMIEEQQSKVLKNEQKINNAYSRLQESENKLQEVKEFYKKQQKEGFGSATSKLNTENAIIKAETNVKSIEKEIAGYRSAIYQANKISKDLEKNINIEDLIFDSGGTEESKDKAVDNLKDYLDELTKLREDNEDRQVELMEDGTEKQIAEIKLRYKRMREKVQELENNLYNSQGGKLTKEQSAMFNIAYTGIEELQSRDERKATEDAVKKRIQAEREAMRDYLKEYGSYQEKRLAITEEYQQKISKAETEGEKLRLKKQLEEALKELSDEEARLLTGNSGFFSRLFSDSSAMTRASLKKVIREAKELTDYLNGFSNKKPAGYSDDQLESLKGNAESIKGIYDALIEKQDELDRRTDYPFNGIVKGFEKLKESSELANKALKETDTQKKNILQGQSEAAYGKGVDYLREGAVEASDAVGYLSEQMSALADATGNAKFKEFSDQFSAFSQNLQAAGQGAQSGGWIGAIVGGASDMINQTFAAFAQVKAEEYEFEQNRIDFLQELERLSVTLKEEDYDSIFGVNSIEKAREAYVLALEALRKYEEAVSERTMPEIEKEYKNLGAAIFSGGLLGFGFGKRISEETKTLLKAYEKGYTDLQAMAVKTKDRSGWANFWGKKDEYTALKDLAPQLWDDDGSFNIDAAEAFLETNTQINDEQRKQIQNVIDLKKAYDENISVIDEMLSSTFGNLSEDITDAIFDSVRNGADAWSLFEEAGSEVIDELGRQLVQQMYVQSYLDTFTERMRAAYGLDSMQDTQEELASIMKDIFSGLGTVLEGASSAAEAWDKMAEEYGFSIDKETPEQQSASSGGYETMTQDQASELNGRFTALNESSLRQEAIQQGISDIADDMRNIIAQSYLELQQISENTGAIIVPIQKMQKDMEIVKQNTSRI